MCSCLINNMAVDFSDGEKLSLDDGVLFTRFGPSDYTLVLLGFIKEHPDQVLKVIYKGELCELAFNDQGNLAVVAGVNTFVLSLLYGKVAFTHETVALIEAYKATLDARASEEVNTDVFSSRFSEALERRYDPLKDDEILAIIRSVQFPSRFGFASTGQGVLPFTRPIVNVCARIIQILEILKQKGVRFEVEKDVVSSSGDILPNIEVNLPNRVIYFDSDGHLKRVFLEIFTDRSFPGLRASLEQFLNGSNLKNVLVLSTYYPEGEIGHDGKLDMVYFAEVIRLNMR